MAYNSRNHKNKVKNILAVYDLYKEMDIADTQIVKKKFPEHGIFISYRTWMGYKGLKPSQLN